MHERCESRFPFARASWEDVIQAELQAFHAGITTDMIRRAWCFYAEQPYGLPFEIVDGELRTHPATGYNSRVGGMRDANPRNPRRFDSI